MPAVVHRCFRLPLGAPGVIANCVSRRPSHLNPGCVFVLSVTEALPHSRALLSVPFLWVLRRRIDVVRFTAFCRLAMYQRKREGDLTVVSARRQRKSGREIESECDENAS